MIRSLAVERGAHCEERRRIWRRPPCFSAAAVASLPFPPAAGQGHVHARHWPAASRRPAEGVWGRGLFLACHRQHAPFALAGELVLPPRLCFPVAGKHLHPEIDEPLPTPLSLLLHPLLPLPVWQDGVIRQPCQSWLQPAIRTAVGRAIFCRDTGTM